MDKYEMYILYDNHNHSQFSFDGKRTSVEISAAAARDKGLAGICFTDHCDFYVPPMKAAFENLVPETFDVKAQQAEIDRVNEVISPGEPHHDGNIEIIQGTGGRTGQDSGPQFRIFKGVEIGMQKNCRDRIREFLSGNSFDEVIASVHYLDDTDPFYGGYYEGKDWKTAYGHYLETIYEEMTWLGDFDIMGHYDYVARYAPYPQASILYKDFGDIFDAILKYLAENGKAIEINTKTYQDYKGRTPVLDRHILLRFKELGGEAISLGSDSHDPIRPGDKFLQYAEFVRSLGFRHLAHFEGRRLVMTPIP